MKILDIVKIIPKKNPRTGSDIVLTVNKEKIKIVWINRGKNGKILNLQNQPKPITIPRFLVLSEEFGEVLGMYYGDGTKNDTSCVEFANSAPELLLMWIKFLENYKIPKKEMKFIVKVAENAKLKYNISEDEIRDYWRNILCIPKKKEIKVVWVKTPGKPSEYIQRYGTVAIRYSNATFSFFFNLLIQNLNNFIIKSREFLIGFLRGVVAAEGNVNLRANGSLSLIRIAGNKKERNFISSLFIRYLKIRTKDDDSSNQIYISSLKNLRKVKKLKLVELNLRKKQQFEMGYERLIQNIKNKKHDSNCVLKNRKSLQLLYLLSKNSLTKKQLVKYLKISDKYVRNLLNGYTRKGYKYNGLKKLGLIKSVKINGREKLWKITPKGQEFLMQSILEFGQPYVNLELRN